MLLTNNRAGSRYRRGSSSRRGRKVMSNPLGQLLPLRNPSAMRKA